MAEEYEQLELAEQGQGISSPPPSERQVRGSVDVYAARALQEAARDGREDLLDYLLECCTEDQIDINALDKEGFAALHKAVMYHRVNIIKKLLAAKCDPDVLTKDGLTPLHIAACHLPRGNGTVTEGASHQVIKLLLEFKGKSAERRLKACNAQFKHTPLHMACSRANVPAVQVLLKHIQGVDLSIVNAQDWQKDTPLHEACIRGNLFIVKELLKHGADVNAQNDDGKNPLQIACKGGYAEVVKAILDYNCEGAKKLAEARVEGSLNTAMHLAVENRDIEMVKVLLAYKVNPSMSNYDKVAPIHIAAGQGYTDIARVLLDRNGSCLNLCDEQSRSPLHYATRNNQVEMIELLISQGCNKELSDGNSVSPLLLSAKLGKAKAAFALIIGGCDMNTTDKDGKSAVYWAAQEGHTDVLRNLLKNKEGILLVHVVEPSHRNTPFHIAAKMGRAEAIKLLALGERLQQLLHQLSVEREAISENDPRATERRQTLEQERVEMEVLRLKVEHLDFKNDEHKTPLHLAAMSGNMEVVRLLFHKYSPSLTVKDNEGNTPFHLAVVSGNMEIVRFLVDKYPPFLTGKNKAGFTPLHLAAKYGKTEVADVLIREGAKVDARWDANWDASGSSPIHLAVENGHAEVIALLIKADASLGAVDKWNRTPLHLAVMKSCTDIISLLTAAGAPLEAKDFDVVHDLQMTPLHRAVVINHAEIISLLIDAGAQLEAKDNWERTPLFLACSIGHLAAAEVLIHKGADVTAHVLTLDMITTRSCLDLAVKKGHKDVALAIIQSDQWKAALRHSNDQMTPFRRMIQQMPSVAQAVLNRCMEVNYEFDEATIFKVKVGFNYEFLDDYRDEPSQESHTERTASNSSSENTEDKNKWGPEFSAKNHPLAQMVKYKRDDLLKHPVVTSLLEYKWRTYGGAVFLFNLITYLIFLFFLTLYALLLPHPDHRFCHDFSVTQSVASLPVNGTVCPFELSVANHSRALNIDPTVPMNNHANVALYFAAVVVIISVLGRLLLEISQLVFMRHRYFLKIENYIELLAYISAIIFVSHFGTNCWCPTNWQWQLGAFGVFLAWINLILFLKRLPLLGIYVLMFNAILHTFLKFALIAFLFVMAFGIGFYMILYKALDEATLIVNVSPFRNAGLSFIKTMVMAIGEFEYDSIFGHSNDSSSMLTSFPEVAYILWIVFLIVMPILLTNLLVGLAVGDIKDVQDQAQLKSNLLQIEADELLPACIRRKFKRKLQIINPHQRGWNLWWRKFMKKVWGAEYCNSIDTILKHHEVSTIEQVQSQTEQLSKEVEKLQTKMTVQLSREVGKLQKAMSPIEQVQTQTEQLSRQVNELQTEISPIEQVQAQTEQLSREVKNLQIELMEKNNRMEQVLMMMAKKQGIQWDPEEAEK